MKFFLPLFLALLSSLSFTESAGEASSSCPFLVIIYGPRGSGKAAIAARLRVDFDLPDISPATYLSSNVLDETPLGNKARNYVINGGPMPPDLLPSLLCDRLLESDCCRGALMEDVFLSVEQIQAIQECLSPRFQFLAINIETGEDWILQKAENRVVCHSCGRVYELSPNGQQSNCDNCSSLLEKRQADSLETIQFHVQQYQGNLVPLLNWYKEENILIHVCGEKAFNDIYEEVATIIEKKTGLFRSKSPRLYQTSFSSVDDLN